MSIFYNSYKNHIIRTSFSGIKNFNIEDNKDGKYIFNRHVSFYDADYKFLGKVDLGDIDERFMFFDENNLYVFKPSVHTNDDELIFLKYKYPGFD